MNKVKVNVISSLLLQIVTILSGLIVPRIILSSFGSEVNGLISSISQFLNYIQLLEGGLSGVIMASLYKPLANHDTVKISGVINATEKFFKQIGLIYVAYMVVVGVVYPIMVKTSFNNGYVFALTLIIGFGLFIQYFFALTYKILLTADRKVYIISLSQIILVILNTITVVVLAKLFRDILVLKIGSAVVFLAQPMIYQYYTKKYYRLDKSVSPDTQALSQRWDGFGQNLAFFIHNNTDIVILTMFASLTDVSIYSVYFMVVSHLKSLVVSISNAVNPSLGNILASEDSNQISKSFDMYDFAISFISSILFTCGIVLITPFVIVYTKGINDANYLQPIFGLIIGLAEWVYCFRDPYISACYASGHFKQTAKYAYIEAVINITISIVLVQKLGIVGVAIGTLVSMSYRMLAHVIYIKRNILFRNISKFTKKMLVFLTAFAITYVVFCLIVQASINTIIEWIIYAIIVFAVTMVINIGVSILFYKKELFALIKKVIH